MRVSIVSLFLLSACAAAPEASYVGTLTRVECPTNGEACVTSVEHAVHAVRLPEDRVEIDGECVAQLELYGPTGFKVVQDTCYASGEGTIDPCRIQIVTRRDSASLRVETHYDGARACR